jgi:polysaccharide chain length determinant protein (PEP-CTERM system associated)
MDNLRILLQQYVRAVWRRRWLGIVIAWLVCAIGWVAVLLIPNQFESSARLFVDADAVLTPLLRGIAADSSPSTQLELLQRTLLSRPNLEKLVSRTNLDLTIRQPSDRERLLKRLGNTIKVTPQTKSLFTITYRDPDPKLAHDVVQTLLSIFIESATGTNRSDMDNARRFLEHQIASYEQQLRTSEKRRADFRAKYIDILPLEGGGTYSAVEAARRNVEMLDGRLADAKLSRDALKQEVENTPSMLVVETDTPQGIREAGARPGLNPKLQEAEAQLRMLLLKDTENHPDVIAQRKLIAALKAEPLPAAPAPTAAGGTPDRVAMAAAAARAAGLPAPDTQNTAGMPSGARRSVPNPVYDQLKVKLIEADTQLVSLQRQRDEADRYQKKLEKIQREQPGLLAEYQNMDRDYGVLRKNYEELLGRLQAANIAQAADTQADKVKLQIVDPPEIPRLPVAPNRMLLVSGVLLVGLGAGAGITVLFSQLDKSFATVDDLRSLGLPVLGGISVLGLAPLRQRLMIAARFGAAVMVLVGIYGVLMLHILRGVALI